MKLVVSWEYCDVDSIPSLAQWVRLLVMLQQWLRSCLQLKSDPWPGNTICHRVAKKKKKKSSISDREINSGMKIRKMNMMSRDSKHKICKIVQI